MILLFRMMEFEKMKAIKTEIDHLDNNKLLIFLTHKQTSENREYINW